MSNVDDELDSLLASLADVEVKGAGHSGATAPSHTPTPAAPATPAAAAAEEAAPALTSATTASLTAEIDKLRKDPAGYASVLGRLRQPFYKGNTLLLERGDTVKRYQTEEGERACQEAMIALRSVGGPLPQIVWVPGLHRASEEVHGRMNADTSVSVGGEELNAIVFAWGRYEGKLEQKACWGATTAEDILCDWLISDGERSRESRTFLLSPDYQRGGACVGPFAQAALSPLAVVHFAQTWKPVPR